MDEKTLELIEKLTDKVEALEASNKELMEKNKELSWTVAKLAKEAGVKSKEEDEDEADDKAAEELFKSLAVVGKDMA